MIHKNSVLKVVGKTKYTGELEVMITFGGITVKSHMTQAEYDLSMILTKLNEAYPEEKETLDALHNAIEDYGSNKYSEGYDEDRH